MGSNGSGKSSLLKLLNHIYQPTSGKIYFKQKNLQTYATKNLSQSIVTFTQDLRDCLFFDDCDPNCLLWETRFQKNFLKSGYQKDMQFFKAYLAQFLDTLSALFLNELSNIAKDRKSASERVHEL